MKATKLLTLEYSSSFGVSDARTHHAYSACILCIRSPRHSKSMKGAVTPSRILRCRISESSSEIYFSASSMTHFLGSVSAGSFLLTKKSRIACRCASLFAISLFWLPLPHLMKWRQSGRRPNALGTIICLPGLYLMIRLYCRNSSNHLAKRFDGVFHRIHIFQGTMISNYRNG